MASLTVLIDAFLYCWSLLYEALASIGDHLKAIRGQLFQLESTFPGWAAYPPTFQDRMAQSLDSKKRDCTTSGIETARSAAPMIRWQRPPLP